MHAVRDRQDEFLRTHIDIYRHMQSIQLRRSAQFIATQVRRRVVPHTYYRLLVCQQEHRILRTNHREDGIVVTKTGSDTGKGAQGRAMLKGCRNLNVLNRITLEWEEFAMIYFVIVIDIERSRTTTPVA